MNTRKEEKKLAYMQVRNREVWFDLKKAEEYTKKHKEDKGGFIPRVIIVDFDRAKIATRWNFKDINK